MSRAVLGADQGSRRRVNDAISMQLDFVDPIVRANPYPVFARLRQIDPVHRAPRGNWIITRYADVDALNRDRRLGRDLRRWGKYDLFRPYLADSALERSVERWMISIDPPDHTRIRRMAAHAFSPGAMAVLRMNVERTVDGLLEGLDGVEEFEYVGAFARPLCVLIIGDLLSFPRADYPTLDQWASKLCVVLEPTNSAKQKVEGAAAAASMTEYVREIVRARRKEPRQDLVSHMATSLDSGEATDEDEVVANVIGLFVAGVTNTIIPNGLYQLLTHPDEFERLRRDSSLVNRAVEGLLRFDSRGINARLTLEDVELGEKVTPAGQMVLCMLGAANRDPEVFEDPDRLDLSRHPNPHLTFGGGIHHCLGAALTRLEARVAFDRLPRKWSGIEMDEDSLEWTDFFAIRSVARMPVHVTAR